MARRKIIAKYMIGLTYGIEINNFENVIVLFYTDFDAMSCAGSNEIVANEVEKKSENFIASNCILVSYCITTSM
jgi:hypothetical protein